MSTGSPKTVTLGGRRSGKTTEALKWAEGEIRRLNEENAALRERAAELDDMRKRAEGKAATLERDVEGWRALLSTNNETWGDTTRQLREKLAAALQERDALVAGLRSMCPGCDAGKPRVDIHSRIPTGYHGYAYSPCKIPEHIRKLVPLYPPPKGPGDE